MPKKKREPVPVDFTVEFGDKVYEATYTIEKGCLTVVYWGPDADRRVASTQVGGHAAVPELLARRLLMEMLRASVKPK
jgi:hypothetical protein